MGPRGMRMGNEENLYQSHIIVNIENWYEQGLIVRMENQGRQYYK